MKMMKVFLLGDSVIMFIAIALVYINYQYTDIQSGSD